MTGHANTDYKKYITENRLFSLKKIRFWATLALWWLIKTKKFEKVWFL